MPRTSEALFLCGLGIANDAVFSVIMAYRLFMHIRRIRLNSFDFRDLKDKLQAPVQNARQILIQQSLSEKFIQAFFETASANPKYRMVSCVTASRYKTAWFWDIKFFSASPELGNKRMSERANEQANEWASNAEQAN